MKTLNLAILLVGLVMSSVASGADEASTIEISGNANATFSHVSVDQEPGSTDFSIGATADYFLMPALEVGLQTAVDFVNSFGRTENTEEFLVGPTFNFLGAPANSFFISARAGIQIDNLGDGLGFTLFAWNAYVGKRFEIVTHVEWAPEVGFTGQASETNNSGNHYPSTTTFQAVPFRFSVLF